MQSARWRSACKANEDTRNANGDIDFNIDYLPKIKLFLGTSAGQQVNLIFRILVQEVAITD